MPVAELEWPLRLLAGGGPAAPEPRVLSAMGAPVIGQFDPDFTAIMDDVTRLARTTFMTENQRCFAVSGLASAGLESLLNTLIQPGDTVAIGGGTGFVAETAEMARRYGAETASITEPRPGTKLWIVPFVDPQSTRRLALSDLAQAAHASGALLVVEASLALAASELRIDDWGIDACTAGADYAISGPSGMTLVTYSSAVEEQMAARSTPPSTSYLDLLQLQAYWSPERLNHHTAPTSLVYGLREALRLVHAEGLEPRWARHARVGRAVRAGLEAQSGLDVGGDEPYAVVHWPAGRDEAADRRTLLDQFGVHVRLVAAHTWRVGLLGADARLDAALRVVTAVGEVLHQSASTTAAREAFGTA